MTKEKPNISVGAESFPDEYEAVQKAFEEDFDATITGNIQRFSEGELPFLVSFTIGAIAYGVFYDLLKKVIHKLLDNHKAVLNRKTIVSIRKEEKEAIITRDSCFIRTMREDKNMSL